MTILITGSAGHLGEALMRTLSAAGRKAFGLDLKPSPYTGMVGSILDRDFVRHCIKEVDAVVHAATLHKPHVGTHPAQDFVDTNVSGTLILLEEAVRAGVGRFVYTSTTSAFGSALRPSPGDPAAWITEEVRSVPKNIYGVTKKAAEDLCEMFARRGRLAAIILRTARFFPEEDDDALIRSRYETANAQANELLYRRADLEDVASAHLAALEQATRIGFGRYIISATTPFQQSDLPLLHRDAPSVVRRYYPEYDALYEARGWTMFPAIDRVYLNRKSVEQLAWRPRYDFRHVLECLRAGRDFLSPLARAVGEKGYHDRQFAEGPYPVVG
ncbi:MAG TPA: NAD(P)-dependent oxidoreductase, partial [Rhizomicrobium sp.]|nr:NAD(P)-dependent oxidoreductase [Rhizomicrobium sp.]